jgi:hypothetical protein
MVYGVEKTNNLSLSYARLESKADIGSSTALYLFTEANTKAVWEPMPGTEL